MPQSNDLKILLEVEEVVAHHHSGSRGFGIAAVEAGETHHEYFLGQGE